MPHVVLDTGFGRGERFATARGAGRALHYIALLAELPPAQELYEQIADVFGVQP
jgi:tRNA 5-methylaminomethyl-2-thiouridine biosynthesis bifunctional protein